MPASWNPFSTKCLHPRTSLAAFCFVLLAACFTDLVVLYLWTTVHFDRPFLDVYRLHPGMNHNFPHG
jgi:hypothetical protein